MKSLIVTSDTNALLAARNTKIKGILLCAGSDAATVEVYDGATVSGGTSIAKLAAVANESAAPLICNILTTNGVSVDISGTNAKAYIIYE